MLPLLFVYPVMHVLCLPLCTSAFPALSACSLSPDKAFFFLANFLHVSSCTQLNWRGSAEFTFSSTSPAIAPINMDWKWMMLLQTTIEAILSKYYPSIFEAGVGGVGFPHSLQVTRCLVQKPVTYVKGFTITITLCFLRRPLTLLTLSI